MDLYNVQTRQKDVIDDPAALQEALLKGTHAFKAGSTVSVKDPNGDFGTVPAENIYDAIKQGFQVETGTQKTVREYLEEPGNRGLSGSLKVGVGQALDETALGIPELILDKTQDPLEVAKRQALKDEHGFANTIGGLTGFGASLLLGGPLWKAGSVAGKAVTARIAEKIAIEGGEQIGKRTATKVARDLTARAAGTATEGAIVSAPIAITEAALGDPDEAAQTLLAGAGIGALFGVAQGTGKELLGLSKKVANRTAEIAQVGDVKMRKVARQTAAFFTALDEEDILHYMKNMEKVNKAPDFEMLKQKVDDAYNQIESDFLYVNESFKRADDDLGTAYKNIQRDLNDTAAPMALADDLADALDAEKAVLGELSKKADEALVSANIELDPDDMVGLLQNLEKKIIPLKVGKKVKSAKKSIRDLISDIEELGGTLDGPATRDLLQAVREDIDYSTVSGEFNARANRIFKEFTRDVSKSLKGDSYEYAAIMEQMHDRTTKLSQMSKAFGDPEKGQRKLTQMLKPGNEYKRKLLEEFSELADYDVTVPKKPKGTQEVFHGSSKDFKLDDIKLSTEGTWGSGVYAADLKEGAENYGKFIKKFEVDPKTILDASGHRFPEKTIKTLEGFGFNGEAFRKADKYKSHTKVVHDEIERLFPGDGYYGENDKLRELLQKNGFSGVKFPGASDRNNKVSNYVIFDKKGINPLVDQMLVKRGAIDQVDNDIIDVFHGTFKDFDPADLKPSQGGHYGTGFYLTPDKQAASNYGEKVFNYKVDAKTIADVSEGGFDDGVMAALQDAGLDINKIKSPDEFQDKFSKAIDEVREKFPDQAVGYDAYEKLNQILKDRGYKGLKFRQNNADNFLIFDKAALYAKPKAPDGLQSRFDKLLAQKDKYRRIQRGEDMRPELLPELTAKRDALLSEQKQKKALLDSVKKVSPAGSEQAMRRMGYARPDINTRKAFEALEAQIGEPFLDMIKDRNILDSFYKQTTQGSRKTNLGATVAWGFGGAAIPATLGMGPLIAAAGAVVGAGSDIYGGRWIKSFIDNNRNFAGLLFVEKAMRKTAEEIDRIPGIIDRMSNNPSKLGAQSISLNALFRLLGEDERAKTKDAGEALEKVGDKMRTWLSDPANFDEMMGKFTNPLNEGGAPKISQGLSIGAIRALEYLESNIPKPPKPSSPFAPKVSWTPSDNELSTFTQKLQVAENPMVVLDELEAGTLTLNHMDALKTMFPYVYQRIQEKVMDTAVESPRPLTYNDRMKLSILADANLDDSLSDSSFLFLQSKFLGENEQEDLNEQQFSPKQGINLAQANQTTFQSAILN